jgi:4-hydroxybenzoate polyprenyltransferase
VRHTASFTVAFIKLLSPGLWTILTLSFLFGYLPGGPSDAHVLTGYLFVFSVGYGFTLLLNHYYDRVEDRVNLPERSRVAEQIGYPLIGSLGWLLTLGLFVIPLALEDRTGWPATIVTCIALAGALVYSPGPRLKGRPFVAPLNFAFTGVMPFLAGWFAKQGELVAPPLIIWLIVLYYVVYGPLRHLPDVEGDRTAGIRTLPRLYEGRAAARIFVALLVPYAAVVGCVIAGWLAPRFFVVLALVPASILIAVTLARAQSREERESVRVLVLAHRWAYLVMLFLCYWPTVVGLACVTLIQTFRVGVARFGLDTRGFGLTLRRLSELRRLLAKPALVWEPPMTAHAANAPEMRRS